MFDHEKNLRERVSFCIEPEDKKRLALAAKADHRTPSELVRLATMKELSIRGF